MNILSVNTVKRRLGDFGEDEAVKLLRRKGYRIAERNYAPEGSEIDIIAYSGETIVFIEVKTRSKDKITPMEPRPASAVTPEKQRAIIEAAKIYLTTHRDHTRTRFDIIEVYASGSDGKWHADDIKHIEGAFNRDTASADFYKRRRR